MSKVLPQDLIDYLEGYNVSPEDLNELTDDEIKQLIEEFHDYQKGVEPRSLDGILDRVCSHYSYGKGAEM
jgi:hypothetical protein